MLCHTITLNFHQFWVLSQIVYIELLPGGYLYSTTHVWGPLKKMHRTVLKCMRFGVSHLLNVVYRPIMTNDCHKFTAERSE